MSISSTSSGCSASYSLLDDELRSAVLLEAIITAVRAEWTLLAVADDFDAIRFNARGHQRAACGFRSLHAQGDVVFSRPSFIGISSDGDANARVSDKKCCVFMNRA